MSGEARKSARFIYVSEAVAGPAWRDPANRANCRVGWRVIAGNNRPLGRSAVAFGSLAECIDDAMRLHKEIEAVMSSVLFNSAVGHWHWSLHVDGDAVAVCVHPYVRRVECMRAVAQFVAAVQATQPQPDELRLYGPNALRAYDLAKRPALVSEPRRDPGIVR